MCSPDNSFIFADPACRCPIRLFRNLLIRFDQRVFENIVATAGAFRRLFQKIIRKGRIVAGNTVENALEGDPGKFRIAVLAGLDERLDLADRRAADQDNIMLSEAGIEEVLFHSALDSSAQAPSRKVNRLSSVSPAVQTNQTQMTAVNALIVIRKVAIVGMNVRRVKRTSFWKVQ